MKWMAKIRFVVLATVIAGSFAAVTQTAKGSPVRSHKPAPNHRRALAKGQDDPSIPFGPPTVTVVDMPVPPDLLAPPATQPSGSPSPGGQATSPQVVTTPTTAPTSTGGSSTITPQVVTTPAAAPPAAVTTPTTAPPVVLPPPPCLNHPDYPVIPKDWTVSGGNCYPPPRGEDNYLLCHGDEAKLVAYSGVDAQMKSGYVMGIWVDGVPGDRHGNCIITDLATYKLDPSRFVFSGMYVQDGGPGDGGPWNTPLPFPWSQWKPLYPYWVPKTQAAQYVQAQSLLSIQAYGLLWSDGNRYQTANSFARYLKLNHLRWTAWKKQFPGFAAALTSHQSLLRRLRRR